MSKTTVLVADDASFMRQMVYEICEGPEFTVVGEASDGLEALVKFRELSPDLVVFDIIMPPGKDATLDALKRILATNSRVRIILSEAFGQETLVMAGLQAGALDFVVKPFKAEELIDTLRKVRDQQLLD